MVYTYIIKYLNYHNKFNYYCGITYNLNRRKIEHTLGLRTKNKKEILSIIYIIGNYEKRIKFCGVKNIYILVSKFNRLIGDEDESEPKARRI